MRLPVIVLLSAVLLLGLLPAAARAAGPVRVETEHFVFVHNGHGANLADKLAGIAEVKRRYIRALVGLRPEGAEKIEVRIAINDEEMSRMTGSGGRVDEWVAGITFIGRDLIVMSARGNEFFKASDTFVHELAHYYLDEAVGDLAVPRWFHEGFAMLASSEEIGDRMHSLLGAAATDSFFSLAELSESFPDKAPAVHLAYAESMFFIRYLQTISGSSGVPTVISKMRVGMPFDLAFMGTWGRSPEAVFANFRATFSPLDSVIAFLTSATLLWAFVVGIFLVVYRRKKKQAAMIVQRWELEEELERERIFRVLQDGADHAGDRPEDYIQ